MSIAQSILETAERLVREQGTPGRLEWVRVAVGELTAVEPDLLAFAWEAVTSDSESPRAMLQIEFRPARQRCTNCGIEVRRTVGSWITICQECGAAVLVEGGDELDILQLSYFEGPNGSG